MENCIDTQKCTRKELNIPSGERYELCEAVHAEQNAIINAPPDRMKGATIYIAGFEEDRTFAGGKPCEEDRTFAGGKPCKLCDRIIKNAQIKDIVYLEKDGTLARTTMY
jgi:dCMP deaminase